MSQNETYNSHFPNRKVLFSVFVYFGEHEMENVEVRLLICCLAEGDALNEAVYHDKSNIDNGRDKERCK